ncbi:MAG: low molecular weight phosphotyrosine protein phosphatase [Flavobacteriales bacterium]|nr:low molecular weight phosphotyrosine protein phosphatase [Flavobacteriales bacterium]
MKIITVCLGNICRSPMAEGILRHLARERGITIRTDSAGTSDYHVGEAPDRRAQAAMKRKGIDIGDLRARQFVAKDLEDFDIILAMDASNLQNMLKLAPNDALAAKAYLIMDHAPAHPLREVPDPYFGGDEGFDAVYHMLMDACNALLDEVEQRTNLKHGAQ